MRRDMPDRILTTHVGSLIRPPKLIEFWRAIEDGKPYDEAAFEACLTQSIAEVVRQQADTGIAIRPATPEELNDPLASMSGGQDRKAFAEFYNEYDIANGLAKRLGNR